MSRSVYEVDLEGQQLTIWEAGIGHRVIFDSPVVAQLQADILQKDERLFHEAKAKDGVYVIYKYGEHLTPVEYIQRLFKVYRSKVGQHMGVTVYERCINRLPSEYW